MKKIFNNSLYFSIAILISISVVLFVPAIPQAEAQSGVGTRPSTTVGLCLDLDSGAIQKAFLRGVDHDCPVGTFLHVIPEADKGFCTGRVETYYVLRAPSDPEIDVNSAGTECMYNVGQQAYSLAFRPFSSVTSQYTPPGTTPPGTTPPGTTPPGTTPPGTGTGTTPKPVTQVRGDCEEGFHKVGPLCVPNSPFTDPDAPVNSPDAGGLAVRLIKILLYFAGIVAVIMAIVGGYQIMTARGNETQATNGRKTLTNAIIGLIIVILSYVIVQAVINFVTKA